MKYYYSIESGTTEKTVIKKSVFIASAFPIESAEEAEIAVGRIKREYYDATHNCYAYIAGGNEARFSDDGEPQGTAGLPILSVLKKRGLNKILVIVTRYFGGVKLGAAGLVSAYSESALNVLNGADIKKYVYSSELKLRFDYSFINAADGVLKDFGENVKVCGAEYSENVLYSVFAAEDFCDSFKSALVERTNGLIAIEDGEKGYRALT
ncbi:MAG: YigZ family protein [Clostridiales bacterium]|jgi:uncharacterized YigZ family protein|nr:YigZ family protein [Clostridiales bacterium]